MNNLATREQRALKVEERVDAAEAVMLELPQAEAPVVHHFGPGVYIREVHLPKGVFAIGHRQRFEHLNIVLTGAVAMINDQGKLQVIKAPTIFTGQPGRKIGFVLENTIWQNVYATEERDIDTLEAAYLEKSVAWHEHDAAYQRLRRALHDEDRADYAALLDQLGLTEETVRAQSENEDDQVPLPDGLGVKVTVRNSYIEGKGVFLSASAEEGELLAPARLGGYRTPVGRYINHSKMPNAKYEIFNNDVYLTALRPIMGCQGGDQGEEVTVDYRQALSLSGIMVEDLR